MTWWQQGRFNSKAVPGRLIFPLSAPSPNIPCVMEPHWTATPAHSPKTKRRLSDVFKVMMLMKKETEQQTA